jgi:hypothetical protein
MAYVDAADGARHVNKIYADFILYLSNASCMYECTRRAQLDGMKDDEMTCCAPHAARYVNALRDSCA